MSYHCGIMRKAFAVLAAASFTCANAAESYKCKDAAERITYSNVPCEKQGLKPAGTVRDRLMVVPASKPPAQARPAEKRDGKDEAKREAAIKPVNPLTEKLAK